MSNAEFVNKQVENEEDEEEEKKDREAIAHVILSGENKSHDSVSFGSVGSSPFENASLKQPLAAAEAKRILTPGESMMSNTNTNTSSILEPSRDVSAVNLILSDEQVVSNSRLFNTQQTATTTTNSSLSSSKTRRSSKVT